MLKANSATVEELTGRRDEVAPNLRHLVEHEEKTEEPHHKHFSGNPGELRIRFCYLQNRNKKKVLLELLVKGKK